MKSTTTRHHSMALLTALVFVSLHGIFLWQTLPGASDYRLYLPELRWVAFGWISIAILTLPVVTTASALIAFGAKDYVRVVLSAILMVAGGAMVYVSFIMWWAFAFGYGNGRTITETAWSGETYRLHYTRGGDPLVSSYTVLKCAPIALWCREVGSIVSWGGYDPVDPSEMRMFVTNELELERDGVLVASYDGERWECGDEISVYTCIDQ